MEKLFFASDYMEGAHPEIIQRLIDTNMEKTIGYGNDVYSESARGKIRKACNAPDADVFFLAGGTQTNAVIIDSVLRSYQGVIAAKTGHISAHEAGAIEYGGHKVLEIEGRDGKITAADIRSLITDYKQDANHDHMVMPGMVYISQPTEYGTLYRLDELKEISRICREEKITLYIDGARLAYALACPENDVTLQDMADLCDVFYIGGTKCGTLLGEAVVIPRPDYIPHLFTIIKQHGALLAKGRVVGIQFDTLFTDCLYDRIGENAIKTADVIRKMLLDKGYELAFNSPTNQIFILLEKEKADEISKKVELAFWENTDDSHVIMRIATSWATTPEDVSRLAECL